MADFDLRQMLAQLDEERAAQYRRDVASWFAAYPDAAERGLTPPVEIQRKKLLVEAYDARGRPPEGPSGG